MDEAINEKSEGGERGRTAMEGQISGVSTSYIGSFQM